MTVVGFIDAALHIAVDAQAQSGPKLVDFKVILVLGGSGTRKLIK